MTHMTAYDEGTVTITAGNLSLAGILQIPDKAIGLILFAHGSGSSRLSVRNQQVAKVLNAAGFATLLFDLLTPSEEATDRETAKIRFDIDLLTSRLSHATQWCEAHPTLSTLP